MPPVASNLPMQSPRELLAAAALLSPRRPLPHAAHLSPRGTRLAAITAAAAEVRSGLDEPFPNLSPKPSLKPPEPYPRPQP